MVLILRFSGEGEILSPKLEKMVKFSNISLPAMLKDSPNIGAGTVTQK